MQNSLVRFSLVFSALVSYSCLAYGEGSVNTVASPPEDAQLTILVAPTLSVSSYVSDKRSVSLNNGSNLVRWLGTSSEYRYLQVLTGSRDTKLLQYKYNNNPGGNGGGSDRGSFLNNYIGKAVGIAQGKDALKGTLLKADGNWLLETSDGLYLNPPGTYVLPRGDLPAAPAPAPPPVLPALEMLFDSAKSGPRTMEARYTTNNLSWNISYRASLDESGDGAYLLSLSGWLTLGNMTGGNFRGARVQLQGVPDFRLERAVDLAPNSYLEVPFLNVSELRVIPELVFNSPTGLTSPYRGPAQSMVRLRNDADAGLGQALPSGPLTTYLGSGGGQLQNALQSGIPYTKSGERLWIPLRAPNDTGSGATANDVMVDRTLAASRQLNPLTTENIIQFVVTNPRNQPVTVAIVERLPLKSKITESKLDGKELQGTYLEQGLYEYKVNVPSNSTATLKYVIETRSG